MRLSVVWSHRRHFQCDLDGFHDRPSRRPSPASQGLLCCGVLLVGQPRSASAWLASSRATGGWISSSSTASRGRTRWAPTFRTELPRRCPPRTATSRSPGQSGAAPPNDPRTPSSSPAAPEYDSTYPVELHDNDPPRHPQPRIHQHQPRPNRPRQILIPDGYDCAFRYPKSSIAFAALLMSCSGSPDSIRSRGGWNSCQKRKEAAQTPASRILLSVLSMAFLICA